MKVPYLVSAIATTALIAGLSIAAMNVAIADDKAWVDELTQELKHAEKGNYKSVWVSHCGKVRKSDISRAIRRVDSGARPSISKNGSRWEAKWLFKKAGEKIKTLKKRFINFTCHHKG